MAQSHNLIEMQMVLQRDREYLAYCKKTNLENSISFVQEISSLISQSNSFVISDQSGKFSYSLAKISEYLKGPVKKATDPWL